MEQNIVVTLVIACLTSSGLASVVVELLHHKWNKEDKKDERIEALLETQKALVDAQKVTMVDRIHLLAKQYIDRGCISLSEKEQFMDIHKAYQGLGGENCVVPVAEVNKLPVMDDCA